MGKDIFRTCTKRMVCTFRNEITRLHLLLKPRYEAFNLLKSSWSDDVVQTLNCERLVGRLSFLHRRVAIDILDYIQ